MEIRAGEDETLADVAREFGVGHNEIANANPDVDKGVPGKGTRVLVPTRHILPDAPRVGVVVNLPEMRLYYYPKAKAGEPPVVITHPVSVGRMDWTTPLGLTKITNKQKKPSWRPPKSIRLEAEERGEPLPEVVPPGPDNPLGDYAMRLAIPGYLIHSTNKPYGVGMRVTHGCIRMYPEDIEALFADIPVGTKVRLVNQPVKAGMIADTLFLEVHPPLEEQPLTEPEAMKIAVEVVRHTTGEEDPGLDLRAAREAIRNASGVPESVAVEKTRYLW
jgi:L,D-transpeptidase ErfK/SrfK